MQLSSGGYDLNNMKTIKTFIFTSIFTLFIFSCKAQTVIPVEEFHSYGNNLEDGDYIKDVNGVLDKYVGIWKGLYDNHFFLFDIRKSTDEFLNIKNDILTIRYSITDTEGKEIINTLSLPDESYYVISGLHMDKDGEYRLFYQGYESNCGQCGEIILHAITDTSIHKLILMLVPMRDMIDPVECPNGTTQLLPTKIGMYLLKQSLNIKPIKL